MFKLFKFFLDPLEVAVDIGNHRSKRGEDIAQLFPDGLDKASNEPHLVLINALHTGHFEALRHLQLQLLLLSEHLTELMAQQCSPGYVVIVVDARIANIAGVKNLLDGGPFMLVVSLYIETWISS